MIAVDRCRAAINAVKAVLPDVERQVCIWHSREAIRSNAGYHLKRDPGPPDASGQPTPSEVDRFLSEWLAMIEAANQSKESIPKSTYPCNLTFLLPSRARCFT